jgi:endoglycosylceramidase
VVTARTKRKTPLEPVPPLTAADLSRMRAIGFDVLRLPIHWSAIEPNDAPPGGAPTYDDAYLDRVAAIVALAKAADVAVLLDLHQDAYSKWIGEDGAPLWAIVPPPDKILDGPLTDLGARTLSQQVQRAFATFFSRTSGDGAKLRARFGAMLAHVAKRFAGDATVIGVELFNEPLATDDELRAFDEEAGLALRTGDARRLVFFEPPATRNLVDHASIAGKPLSLPGVVYAPHVYTHAFTPGDDSAWQKSFTYDDLFPSNDSARQEADSWGAPLFVGEWGWGPNGVRFGDYVELQLDAQDATMSSSTFWLWKEANDQGNWGLFDHTGSSLDAGWSERAAARKAFARVRPRRIAGFPQSWSWDAKSSRFTLDLVGDAAVTAPTIVHVPIAEDRPGPWRATCDGNELGATPDARGDVALSCNGPGKHRIVVEPQG